MKKSLGTRLLYEYASVHNEVFSPYLLLYLCIYMKFRAAILLFRNPYDALVSGYKWEVFSALEKKNGSDPHTFEVNSLMFGK